MSEILPFPNDSERLESNGIKKIEQQDFLSAKEIFLQLYQLEPTFEHCRKLVEATQLLGEFSLALEYAEDYLEEYLNLAESFAEYIHLLILDSQYLAAHRWLTLTPFVVDYLKMELQQVEQAQHLLGISSPIEKQQRLLSWDSHLRPIPQKEWNSWVKGLSLADFLQLCQKYLPIAENPFVIPKLVEELIQIGVTEKMEIKGQWVDLANLKVLNQMPVFQRAMNYLAEQNLTDNQLEELVQTELQAHFALLYPFLPEEEMAEYWVDSYILEYQELFGEKNNQSELHHYPQIQAQKEELRQIYQNLL